MAQPTTIGQIIGKRQPALRQLVDGCFASDGKPLQSDGHYQNLLSEYMDLVRNFEDLYRSHANDWHSVHVCLREEAPELDPATNPSARLARELFEREECDSPVQRDIGHDVEVMIAATRQHVRRGEYADVRCGMQEVSRLARAMVVRLRDAYPAVLLGRRLMRSADERYYDPYYGGCRVHPDPWLDMALMKKRWAASLPRGVDLSGDGIHPVHGDMPLAECVYWQEFVSQPEGEGFTDGGPSADDVDAV